MDLSPTNLGILTWTNFIGREKKRIVGLMVSMLALSEVHVDFGPMSGQTIDYKIGICCFSPISGLACSIKE